MLPVPVGSGSPLRVRRRVTVLGATSAAPPGIQPPGEGAGDCPRGARARAQPRRRRPGTGPCVVATVIQVRPAGRGLSGGSYAGQQPQPQAQAQAERAAVTRNLRGPAPGPCPSRRGRGSDSDSAESARIASESELRVLVAASASWCQPPSEPRRRQRPPAHSNAAVPGSEGAAACAP